MRQFAVLFLWTFSVLAQTPASPPATSNPSSPAPKPGDLTPEQKKDLAGYDFQGALKRLRGDEPAKTHPIPPLQPAKSSAMAAPAAAPSPVPADWHPPRVELNPTALSAAKVAASWEAGYNLPTPGPDGRVVYSFGAGMPVIVCAPLRVCALELEPGEHLQSQPQIGDARRWEVTPITSGSGLDQTALLVLKPIEAGLDTDLVVPTDRRTYVVRLVSSPDRYLSRVAFRYPADDHAKWAAFQVQEDAAKRDAETAAALQKEQEEKRKQQEAQQQAKDKKDGVVPVASNAIEHLYFEYRISGEPNLKPEGVFDDGEHTYIVYPADGRFRELATLMISVGKKTELVNFRVVGNKYIVDRLFDRGVLIVGVGKHEQQKVTIVRAEPFATPASGGDQNARR